MKYSLKHILLIGGIGLAILAAIILGGFWYIMTYHPDHKTREREAFNHILLNHNNYNTMIGHVSPYRMVPDSTSTPMSGVQHFKRTISNYIIAVTLSDSTSTYEGLRKQATDIKNQACKQILEDDTLTYSRIILQYLDTTRDTIFAFSFPLNNSTIK